MLHYVISRVISIQNVLNVSLLVAAACNNWNLWKLHNYLCSWQVAFIKKCVSSKLFFPKGSNRKWEWSDWENTKFLLGGVAYNFLPKVTVGDILVERFDVLCQEMTTYRSIIKDFNREGLSFSFFPFLFYRNFLWSLFEVVLSDVVIPLFSTFSAISLSPKCHCTPEWVGAGDQMEAPSRWQDKWYPAGLWCRCQTWDKNEQGELISVISVLALYFSLLFSVLPFLLWIMSHWILTCI